MQENHRACDGFLAYTHFLPQITPNITTTSRVIRSFTANWLVSDIGPTQFGR